MPIRKVAIIESVGGPDVLKVISEDLSAPAAGEVMLRQTAIGFNFIDVYQRGGAYNLPLPSGLGFEAAGVVEAIGDGVTDFIVGDRVAYMNTSPGAYASLRNVPAEKLVRLPDGVSDEVAASLFFKGMTAQYLLHKTHKVASGELLLVHSAAGGVGQILTRWATALGARVFGTTGSPHKRKAAMEAGCQAVIDLNDEEWPTAFLAATCGEKARVIYDAVGKDTLVKSLDCATKFGLVVSYGGASGKAPAIEPELLNRKGCLYLTRPSVFPHNSETATFRENAGVLFDAIERGYVKVDISQRFGLDDIAEAHRAAEARLNPGALVIKP